MDQQSPDDQPVPQPEPPAQPGDGDHPVTEASKSFSQRSAVFGGIVGLIGSLVGGVVTGSISYFTMTKQLDAQASQEHVKFYREQRQKAYTQLIDDSVKAIAPISTYAYEFSQGDPASPAFSTAQHDAYQRIGMIRDDYSVIRLIGGPKIEPAAKDVLSKCTAVVDDVDNLIREWDKGNLPEPERKGYYNRSFDGTNAALNASDTFADIAKGDLESTK